MMFPAYRCELCNRLHRECPPRCRGCNFPNLVEITLTAQEFCAQFGHDGGEICVPGTERFERTEFRPYVEDGLTIGGSDERISSYEYLFRCARCGFEQRTRR